MEDTSAAGPTALVTGGASGIGRATLERLARTGHRVWSLDLGGPAPVAALCEATGGRALEGDVTSLATATRAVDAVMRVAGRLDRVVCAAGISRGAMLWKAEEADFDRVVAVDLKGCWTVLRAAAPPMREARRGAIVCVSSTAAFRVRAGLTAYAAAKSGLEGLVRGAARDLGPRGVRVNAVAPGLVSTPLAGEIPEDVRARLVADTPLGRAAEPDDVAAVIAFLLSDDARHVTGATLRVDGGLLA